MNLNDFDDLVQEVLLNLWRKLEKYDKEKSKFRTWLSHVTRNTAISYLRSAKTRPEQMSMESDFIDMQNHLRSISDSELETMFEKEWRSYICAKALENMRQIFSGQAVDAFDLTQKEMSAAAIGEQLGLTKDSVYVLVSRVRAKYVKELKRLITEMEF